MIEEWKDVKGYEGLYQVSNFGRVKSLSKIVIRGNRIKQPLKERILKHGLSMEYPFVSLHNGTAKLIKIHKLVAEAFIPNPENKRTVNHKNGIRSDNRACNLEWATYSENHLHSYQKLDRKCYLLGKLGKDHHRSKAIFQFTKSGDFVAEYGSQCEAQRKTKIHQSKISAACLNKIKLAGGYKWKFKKDINV